MRAQLTSFVGREDEVSRVGKALAAYRLVTLAGPGAAGTPLARRWQQRGAPPATR